MKFIEWFNKVAAWVKNFLEDGEGASSHKRLMAVAAFSIAAVLAFKAKGVDYVIAFLTLTGALAGVSAFTKT